MASKYIYTDGEPDGDAPYNYGVKAAPAPKKARPAQMKKKAASSMPMTDGEPDGYAPGLGQPDAVSRAKGGSVKMKKVAQKMKKKGRFGDSELVHVNPAEKKMLEDMAGGITSKNPDTGLDEHFWSVLIPAGIGALTGLARGKGLKGAIKGGLTGAAMGGLTAGLGGLASGEGFMTGLGTMFGGAGQGVNGFGSLLGYGDSAASSASGAGSVLNNSSSFLPNNFHDSMQLGNIGSAVSSAAPVGAAEQTLTGDIGKFLKTPQGMTLALAGLGLAADSSAKDPYADDAERKRAKDESYVRYSGGMADTRFADGGAAKQKPYREYDVHGNPAGPYGFGPKETTIAFPNDDDVAAYFRKELEKQKARKGEFGPKNSVLGAGIGMLMESMGASPGAIRRMIGDKNYEPPIPVDEQLERNVNRNTYASGGPVAGIGSGKSDDIPAMLSDGEHVITADEVSMLGDGSNDAGHKKLYAMRKKLRKHKTGNTKQMPKAKAPEAYAGLGA